jgi:hypothetical protein
MEGLPVPPPQYVVIPSRRMQQRLERRKNWTSMTPEEILLDNPDSASLSTSALEDSSKPSGDQEKDKHSRPDSSSTGRQPRMLSPDSSGDSDRSSALRKRQGQSDSRDEADLPDDIKATEKQLRDLQRSLRNTLGVDTDSNPFSTVPRASTGFTDFFGSDIPKSGWLDQVAHNKAVMEQFKQAMESPLSPAFSSSFTLNPFESIIGSTPGADSLKSPPLGRSPFSHSDALDSRSNALLPPSPGAFGDALTGQSSVLPSEPRLVQPAQQPSLTPPTPTFVFPKRVF